MEELPPILWIVIAIVALLAKSSSKRRKMHEKEVQKPGTPEQSEAWPSWDSPRPAAPRTVTSRPAAPRPATPYEVPAPKHSAAEAPDEFGGSVFEPMIRKTKAARKQLRTAADAAASPAKAASPAQESAGRQPLRPANAKQSAEQPANDANSGIAESFDLRQAIIYSEILKPKFDE